MKSFLKILLAVFLALVAIRFLPLLIASAGVGTILLLAALGVGAVALFGMAAGVLGLLVALLIGALCVVAALSPIWIPVLAIVGIVSLFRSRSKAA